MYKNFYLYRSDIIDARIPITVFYKAMYDAGFIDHPVIFCDKYPTNLAKFNLPIMSSMYLHNIAYSKPIFFVDSLKDISTVNNIIHKCQFILFNDQKLIVEEEPKNIIHNFTVVSDTKLHDVMNFLQTIEL